MKNTYFNDVLNFTVELGVIQKKKKKTQKYIVKNPPKRREKNT